MKMSSKLIFIGLSHIIFISSTLYATEDLKKREDAMYSQRPTSQFDPRLASEYIKEEKEASRKQGIEEGIEEGIEMGRFEKAKTVALRMLSKGMQENDIAEMTDLSPQQIQELKVH